MIADCQTKRWTVFAFLFDDLKTFQIKSRKIYHDNGASDHNFGLCIDFDDIHHSLYPARTWLVSARKVSRTS